MNRDVKLPAIPSKIPPLSVSWAQMSQIPRAKRIPFALRTYITRNSLNNAEVLRYLIDTSFSVAESFGNRTVNRYTKWARSVFSAMEMHKVFRAMVKIEGPDPNIGSKRQDNSVEAIIAKTLKKYFEFSSVNTDKVNSESMVLDFVIQYCLEIDDKALKNHGFEVIANEKHTVDSYGSLELLFIFKHKQYGRCAFFITASSNMSDLALNSRKPTCQMYTERTNSTTRESIIRDFMEACTEFFCRNFDTKNNFINVQSNGDLTTARKIDMHDVEVTTLRYEPLKEEVKWNLSKRRKHAIMLVGDPGLGKTVTVKKLMYDLPNVPFVLMSPIKDPALLSRMFQMFRSFDQVAVVLDDLEKFGVANKDTPTAGVLLQQVEGNTEESNFHGIIISIVNVPKGVDPTLRRTKRLGDNVILVEYPSGDAAYNAVKKLIVRAGHEEVLKSEAMIHDFVNKMCCMNNSSADKVHGTEKGDSIQFSFSDIDSCTERFLMLLDTQDGQTKAANGEYNLLFDEAFQCLCDSIENADLDVVDGVLVKKDPKEGIFARRSRSAQFHGSDETPKKNRK